MLTENILTIRDETAMRMILHEIELSFLNKRISIKDIITERVKHEVDNFNANVNKTRYGLVQPTHAEQVVNQFKLDAKAKVNAETQIEIALRAFETNGFFVLVDNIQAEALNQMVEITDHKLISFIKLTPLVGG